MSTTYEVKASPESVVVDGRARTMTVVQNQHGDARKVPIVLVFHGSMQTADAIRSFTANTFDRIGSESGAIVAYLNGHKKHWNDARVVNTSAARADGMDDVAFAKAAIDLLVRRYNGNPAQVFAVGFSNGGQMVIRLIHEMPEALVGAAILSATQTVPENFAPAAPQDKALPVMLMHGTEDPIVPYAGGMAKMYRFRPRGLGLSAEETAAYYARRNGITNAPTTTSVSAQVDRTDYVQPGHQSVTLYTVREGGHTIPGPKTAHPRFLIGRTDHTLDTAGAITEFFGLDAHSRQA
ncbi:dienelactone hydrolase family protein [Kribbella sp. NBC_01505]|uniref:alpha/beta hydrolase family esterase n=1 Tax=Kribbella sp. NBC_01505 TaxID=2903580 RepID=UPI00386D5AD9